MSEADNLNAIILSAGKGTRMKSNKPKVLHEILGKPMISYVIDHLILAGIKRRIAVVGFGADEVIALIKDQCEHVVQEEQLGTGHAVMMADSKLAGEAGTTVIICGDTPLISEETLKKTINYHIDSKSYATILTTELEDPYGYGRIIRDPDGCVNRIVEEKDASDIERRVTEINTGTYCFDNQALFNALKELKNDNSAGEYYLTDVIKIMRGQDLKVSAYRTHDADEAMGINDQSSLARASKLLQSRINQCHMENGVTMVDPDNTYIGFDVNIGAETIIYPGTLISGKTSIGSHCMIGPNSEITNATIKDHVSVKQSVISNSTIGEHTTVGPFAHIREASVIGDHARVGNFVEIKNTEFGNHSKTAHLTYIGDADVGEHVNMGCGSITANYDGKNKYHTSIGDHSFIGCNVNLVAPITIGKHVLVAAGSTITKDVPDNKMVIARERETVKDKNPLLK